jgi:hypothetical protein
VDSDDALLLTVVVKPLTEVLSAEIEAAVLTKPLLINALTSLVLNPELADDDDDIVDDCILPVYAPVKFGNPGI